MSHATDLTVFTAPGGDRLRVILRDDQPWFVAADVCAALDIGNPSQAVNRLDEDERATLILSEGTSPTSGNPMRSVVSEPGLYSLIMGSRKAEAKAFKRWVTHDVLPTLRRTGQYALAPVVPQSLPEALRAYAAEVEAREKAENALLAANEVLETTEAIVDRMTASQGCLSFAQAGQTLGFGERTFIKHLGRLKLIVYRIGAQDHLRPYENHRRAGRFEIEAQTYTRGCDEEAQEVTTSRTRVTPKGLVYVARLLQQEGALPPRGRRWLEEKESK